MTTPIYPVYNNTIFVAPEAVFSDDPLALSVTSYLIWKNNPSRRWVPVTEVGRPTPEARDLAHEIRRYYLQRNTMNVLKGQVLTEFQYKMNGTPSPAHPEAPKIPDEVEIIKRATALNGFVSQITVDTKTKK